MLSEQVIDKLVERLVKRIDEGNTYVLQKIGENIKQIGTLTSTQAHELVQALKYGGDYDKIVKKLAQITDLNTKDIYKIFDEVAKSDYNFSKQFYEYRNKKFIPYEENTALKRQVQAMAKITANEYRNLTKTMAFAQKVNGKVVYTPIAQAYQDALDKAVLSVAQGKSTFQAEMYSTIKELASSGIRTVDYASGRSMRLDSAVSMNMRSALRNLHNETQELIGEEYGADGVEVSVHLFPAPDHAEVQGRQFTKKEFERFQMGFDAKDYKGRLITADYNGHERRPISELNCYHYVFNIVLGVNEPEYTNKELQEIIDSNNQGFDFNDKHYTNYEGTQLQRRIETEIRKQKDMQIIAKASDNKELIAETQTKITQLTNKYRELSEISGLSTKMERMRVSGYRRVAKSKLK